MVGTPISTITKNNNDSEDIDMTKDSIEVKTVATLMTRCEDGKIYRVAEYNDKSQVAIPINPDGTVKWFDDSKLLRDKKVI